MLIARAEVAGRRCDVRIAGGRVAERADAITPRPGEPVLDAGGGALLPGLHDHHLHLFALAAARASVVCGPPQLRDAAALARALAQAARERPPGSWIRGVGYHESVAGTLDRHVLDALVPAHPLRIQQRSGELWCLNSAACRALELDGAAHDGIERGADGRANGRLLRADAWLRDRLGGAELPALGEVGRELARYGVTGLTDASPENGAAELAAFAGALASGELPQRLVAMGRADLPEPSAPRLTRGALKLRLTEGALPRFDELVGEIAAAHARERAVALHCVTRAELVFAAAAFAAAGAQPGDRIEHASLAPPDALALLAALPLTVVTQPGFVATRGDAYRRELPAEEHPYLYRCRGFLLSGIPLGAGTDAPYGDPDPWAAMRAAVDRLAPDGAALGPDEALTPERALALFTSPAEAPGAAPRRIEPGAAADLCLLDRPWAAARRQLDGKQVVASWCDGRLIAAGAGFVESSDARGPAIPSGAC